MIELVQNNLYLDYALRILASFVSGFCLGLERKIHNHAVGVKTLVLMSISASLLSIVSIEMADTGIITGDPTRIAAGVITGIGFIGGGAILRQGFNIRGITTAALLFTASGIALTFGAGLYYPAALSFVCVMISLLALERMEHKIFPAENTKVLHFEFDSVSIDENTIQEIIKKEGMIILDTDIEYSAKKDESVLSYMVKCPKQIDCVKLAKKFSKLNNLINFTMSKK